MSMRRDLDAVAKALWEAQVAVQRVLTKADDENSLSYEAHMWSDYLSTFRAEATAQLRYLQAVEA